MKAVVMAGGEGTRLRPLTFHCPKPLVPVVNKPVMQHILELLRRHRVEEVVVTLHYLADQIRATFGDGSDFGLKIRYTVEDTPLGTAGSVKLAERWLKDEPFFIISGDSLTDMDLTALREFHHKKRAMVTLALVRVSNPLEYGVVITEEEGRIRRFLEKPDWSEVFSDTINTGIYYMEPEVLERVPEGQPFDWSKDVFPRLLQEGKPLYGFLSEDYWCDIGNLQVYRQAQVDVLSGKVRVEIPGELRGDRVWISPGAMVDKEAILQGPVLIGEGAQIKRKALIAEFSVVGNHTRVEEGAQIINSLLWDSAFVGERARITGAIVGRNTTIGKDAVLNEGVVVGEHCQLGKGCVLASQVKIWPYKIVESGARVTMSLVWGPRWAGTLFRDGAVRGIPNVEMTPDFATRLATAYGACLPMGSTVLTGRDSHPACRMVKRSVIAGLMSAGVDVMDLHAVPEPVARYTARTSNANGGLYIHMSVSERGAMTMEFFDHNGVIISRDLQRRIENAFAREDFRRADPEHIGHLEVLGRVKEYYTEGLLRVIDQKAIQDRKFHIILDCAYNTSSTLVPALLGQLGCRLVTVNGFPQPGAQPRTLEDRQTLLRDLSAMVTTLRADIGVMIDEDGSALHLVDDSGRVLTDHELLALFCSLLFSFQKGTTVVVPISAPSILENLASTYACRVVRCKSDERSLQSAATSLPGVSLAGDIHGHLIYPSFQGAFDGISSLVRLLELLARQNMSLSQAARAIPPYFLEHRLVFCPWERKGEVMRLLSEKAEEGQADFTDGVKFFFGNSWLLYLPDAAEPAFHIYAEAESPDRLQELVKEAEEGLTEACERGGFS